MVQERNIVSPRAATTLAGPEWYKIVACVKWDTFVSSRVPASFPCRSCIGPASSCAILDASSRHYRRTFSECVPGLRLLPQHMGWGRAGARWFCLLGPSYTLVSKIRSVGNRRSTSLHILCEHSCSCWGGGVTHRAGSNQKQSKMGSSSPGHRACMGELDIRWHRSCCRVLVSLEHSGNIAFICVYPPDCCWGSTSEAAIVLFFPLLPRGCSRLGGRVML